MFYLLLSILTSAMISIVMRLSEGRVSTSTGMIACNYLTCIITASLFIGVENIFLSAEGMNTAVSLGMINGFFYMTALLLMQYNIKQSGIVLPALFSKLGLLVPLVLSIFIFGDIPTHLQIIGFILSIAAIIMINYEKGSASSFKPALILLLLTEGMATAMSKIYDELGTSQLSDHFLLVTFTSALILCIIVLIYKKERPGKAELFYGMLIGVPNFFASRFVLMALETVPAVVVYPSRGVATIVAITLAGIIMFKEQLSKRQWFAMSIIMAALIMLNI